MHALKETSTGVHQDVYLASHIDCNRIITGKCMNSHKCGYSECNNCNKYVGKNNKSSNVLHPRALVPWMCSTSLLTILWKNFLEQSNCTNEFKKVIVQAIAQANLTKVIAQSK